MNLQDDFDGGGDNDEEDSDDKSQHNEAPEYRKLIAIHAGKPKGGLKECLKVDPDKVRRLSLSEQQLENAVGTYGNDIVRYLFKYLTLFTIAMILITSCSLFTVIIL